MDLNFSLLPHSIWDSPCLEKLDNLPWSFGFCVDFDGRYLGVRTNDPTVGLQLAEMARERGQLVEARACEYLLSVKVGGAGARRGVKHYNLLYSLYYVIKKSLDLDDILPVFAEALDLAAIKLNDQFIHIDDSRLFAWQANDRLISVVGPKLPCSAIVSGLRPFLEPERSSFTSIGEDGKALFAPWNLDWRGRLLHQPLPLTDLVMLTPDHREISRASTILRLFELSTGKISPEKRVPFLSDALKNVRLHSLPICDPTTLAQRLADLLNLDVVARKVELSEFSAA